MNQTRNEKLRGYSQKLRREMTKEERHLWYDCLKNMDVTFKRQHIMGNYIVDFYCAAAKLVIELDGSQHYENDGMEKDMVRDRYLTDLGILVKRYSNADINQRFRAVCEDIYETVRRRSNIQKPSPQGDRPTKPSP